MMFNERANQKPGLLKLNNFAKLSGEWDQLHPFHVSSILDDKHGLRVSIVDSVEGPQSQIGTFIFDANCGYRNFDEGALWNYWVEIGGIKHTGLYVCSASSFMDWARDNRPDKELHEDLKHYMISSCYDVLEVLAFEEPKFTLGQDPI